MDGRRWWDVAFGVACALVGTIATVNEADEPIRVIGVWIVMAALCLVYYTAGRRTLETEEGSVWFAITLIVLTAIGTAFSTNVLTLQCLVFPLLWVLSPRTRTAIILNIVSASALAVAFVVGIGVIPGVIAQAFAIQSVSLIFSLALGLWITRIAELGNERARLLASLRAAQADSEQASREAGAAAERERMARDIHDTIAQSLTSVVLLAQRARSEVTDEAEATTGRNAAPILESIELIETTAREALGEARALVVTMAAMPATDMTLGDSLRRLGARFERETGVRVRVEDSTDHLPRTAEVVLLRCAQEGLANVRKHAGASTAELSLSSPGSDDDQQVQLRIVDDGVGITGDPDVLLSDDSTGGFGLHGMRDRVALLGGVVSLSNRDEGGTELVIRIPTERTATR